MQQIESTVEDYFLKKSKENGVLCVKFVSPGNAGVPDRLLLRFPGIAGFAEIKRPGEKPRPLQMYWLKVLRKLGFPAYVVDSDEAANKALSDFLARCK